MFVFAMLFQAPAACPDVTVTEAKTQWEADRAWIHEPGWFEPLSDAPTTAISELRYRNKDPFVAVERDGQVRAWPVSAMAYHHVANDILGETPIVVTY